MQVTMYGAGAVGGFVGASLARAGHDVLLVDAAEPHVAAINAGGLTVETTEGTWTVRVPAATPGQLRGPRDLVLLAVKSQHTAGALDTLVPCLGAGGTLVCLQNGLNEEQIVARVGAERTVSVLVNWGADWIAPGRIQWGGPGAFVIGELDGRPSARVRDLAALLGSVGPVTLSDNIRGVKWSKQVFGALLFATALVDADVEDIVRRSRAIQRMLVAIVAENMAVAEALGIRLVAFDEFDPEVYRAAHRGDAGALDAAVDLGLHHWKGRTKTRTGVWRDLAVRRRPTEADGIFGPSLARAERLGLPLPLTRRMIALIHDVEAGRRPMAWENLDDLVTLHRAG